MKRTLLFIVLGFVLTQNLFAQDTLRTRYGGWADFALNRYSTDFRALPGIPNCCPLFTTGSGSGLGIGALYELPIADNLFVGARLGYIGMGASLSATENTTVIIGTTGNPQPSQGTFTHTVDVSLGTLGLEPRIGMRFFNALTVGVGVRAALVLGATYSQKEVTSVGTFQDSLGNDTKSSIRNQRSGDVPNKSSMLVHAMLSAGYELPVNATHTMYLTPEVTYALGLTDVVSGLKWKANSLLFGIALKFQPPPKQHVYDTTVVRDTTPKYVDDFITASTALLDRHNENSTNETDVITHLTTIHESYERRETNPNLIKGSVAAVGLDPDGHETPMATLQIEEFLEVHAHPMLGFIFFEKNSDAISNRYERLDPDQAKRYDLSAMLNLNDVEVHHSVINIIGRRMLEYPNAHITITGCNDDADAEKNNVALSNRRAETIKNYLTSVWSIDPSRMTTQSRNLPQIPSAAKTEDGQAENRRAEIASDDPNVTDIFTVTDTTRVPTPPELRFKTKYMSALPIVSWKLDISQNGRLLKTFSGQNAPPENIDWDLLGDQKSAPHFTAPVELKLTLKNRNDAEGAATTNLPTTVRTIAQKRIEHVTDTVIEKYNLVLFNFGKSDITAAHQKVINAVKERLQPTSKIQIEGYTDRTGNPQSNEKLATARATATQKALGRKDAGVIGYGDRRLIYPNDTPEGRFLCRTVQILVKTPTKQ
ncbi:MAG TPA: OmpA family protein [Candidatus Kapabacteria bacterium]|nr:OmpA family protein [Candidatus Kapabacteria bacterium]